MGGSRRRPQSSPALRASRGSRSGRWRPFVAESWRSFPQLEVRFVSSWFSYGLRLAQWLERRAQLRREECRLFPCREVSAALGDVEVGDAGVDRLDPRARGSPD